VTERHCRNCDHCGMDMDMDPYCVNLKVIESFEKHPYGLSLGSQTVMTNCPTPEHPHFEPRRERP